MLRHVYILFYIFLSVLQVNKTSVENIAFDFEVLTARAVPVKMLMPRDAREFTPRICTQQALEIVSRTFEELSCSAAFSEDYRPRFCACADCEHTSELIAPQDRSANDIEWCLCAALSVLIRSTNQLKLELYRLLRQPVSASRQPRIRDQRTSDITSETGTAVQLAIGEAVPSTVNSSRTFPGVFLHTTVSD